MCDVSLQLEARTTSGGELDNATKPALRLKPFASYCFLVGGSPETVLQQAVLPGSAQDQKHGASRMVPATDTTDWGSGNAH